MDKQPSISYDEKMMRIFLQQEGLEQAIYEQILPAVAPLNMEGVRGAAFVFAPGWIVSNSHVVPDLARLQDGRFANMAIEPDAQRAFFRPKDLGNYPDIMVAHIGEYAGVQPLPNQLSLDPVYESTYYFTIDYRYEDPIRWLTYHGEASEGVSSFSFDDGDLPSRGLSGSPIMAARLRKEAKTPTWSFRLHSMVFAYKGDTNMLCSMPIWGDLAQLQGIMFAKQEQARAEASTFGNQASSFWAVAQQAKEHHHYVLHAYQHGEGASPMMLPQGVEPLFGDEIMPIACSLKLDRPLLTPRAGIGVPQPGSKKAAKKSGQQSNIKRVSFGELKQARDDLYTALNQKKTHIPVHAVPSNNDPCLVVDNAHFRIDYLGSLDKGCYLFALQDNIRDSSGRPIKINDKAASSTFAMAKIFTESTNISVEKLEKVLKQSEQKAAYSYCTKYKSLIGTSKRCEWVKKMAEEYQKSVAVTEGTLCLKAKNGPLQNSEPFFKDNNSRFERGNAPSRTPKP